MQQAVFFLELDLNKRPRTKDFPYIPIDDIINAPKGELERLILTGLDYLLATEVDDIAKLNRSNRVKSELTNKAIEQYHYEVDKLINGK